MRNEGYNIFFEMLDEKNKEQYLKDMEKIKNDKELYMKDLFDEVMIEQIRETAIILEVTCDEVVKKAIHSFFKSVKEQYSRHMHGPYNDYKRY